MATIKERMLSFLLGPSARRFYGLAEFTGYNPGMPNYGDWDFDKMAKEGYIENATAYACINCLTTAMAGIPWKVERKLKNGTRRPYDTHPLLDLLAKPNRSQSGSEYAEAEASYYLIGGNAYTILTGWPVDESRPLTKPPTSLVLAHPSLVKIIPDDLGLPVSYKIGRPTAGQTEGKIYDASRVIHWRKFNPINALFGLGPIRVAAKDVDTLNAMADFFYRLIRRNGRPEGVILVSGKLDDEQFARAKKQNDDDMNNATRPGWKILEGDNVKVQEFSHKPLDMGLSTQEIDRISAVCRAYNVPPECIGVAAAKTYSNYQEARKALYAEGVLPLMDSIRDKRNQQLTPLFSDTDFLDYDRDKIEALQEDRSKAWERDSADEEAGRITANEYRSKWGWPKAADELADQRMVSVAKVPAEELLLGPSTPPAATPTAGGAGSGDGMGDMGESQAEDAGDTSEDPAMDGSDGKMPTKKMRSISTRAVKRGSDMPLVMVRGLNATDTWRAFEDRRSLSMRDIRSRIKTQLADDLTVAAKAMRHTGSQGEADRAVTDALQGQEPKWRSLLAEIYLSVGMEFASSVDAGLEQAFGAKRAKRMAQRGAADSWQGRIADYIQREGGRKIAGINNTTRKRVALAVSSGYRDGLGSDAIADNITANAGIASQARALMIARTETLTASNLGSDAAARSFGIPLDKEWLATADGRTREEHDAANGQTVSMDAPFDVGGDSMMFPGDSSMGAGPDEIINCRCAVVYASAD